MLLESYENKILTEAEITAFQQKKMVVNNSHKRYVINVEFVGLDLRTP